jgi:hypothetical protein
VTSDILAVESPAAGLGDIPLAEMPALGLDVLGKVIGRALPDPLVDGMRAGAFQSSV